MTNKQEVVKEFIIEDGIGAQLWRKVYAMSYAKHNNLLFEDKPITDFLIHESDKVFTEEDKKDFIKNFTEIIINPWAEIDFSDKDNFFISKEIGAGIPETQGILTERKDFTKNAPEFSNVSETDNNVVIHIRRGNVIKENPRWIDEEVYLKMLKDLPKMLNILKFSPERVIVLTDASNSNKKYKPISELQSKKWDQPYLYANENGEFETTSLNFDELRKAYPGVEIINNLNTQDSFKLMLKAKLLIVSRSAFSQVAGLLSKNYVIDMFDSHNGFANSVAKVERNGNIVVLNKNPS